MRLRILAILLFCAFSQASSAVGFFDRDEEDRRRHPSMYNNPVDNSWLSLPNWSSFSKGRHDIIERFSFLMVGYAYLVFTANYPEQSIFMIGSCVLLNRIKAWWRSS